MSERWALALAACVAAGALRPSPVPLAVAIAIALLGRLGRWPAVLCLGGALLASALAQRSLDGLDGLRSGPVAGVVTLLTDPEVRGSGVRAEVRWEGRHLELLVGGRTGEPLTAALAGERLVVAGTVAPLGSPTPWQRSRHLAGRLTVHRWDPGPRAGAVPRGANALRRSLGRGARVLTDRDAALLAGLVVGDDRNQPADLADDFEGAGLTHLLAVSGQNVAFVLALAGPLLRRLRIAPRWLASLALVAGFGALTRFEPSVTRAAAMAAIATTAVAAGQPLPRVRVLALAVAGLLLVDPLLVHALGFRLSVAAALAIVVAATPIAAALPGPPWLAEPLGVTLAAQLGVAPLLLAAFGPLPVASLPANLLAVPAAGLAMAWGMTAGVAAGTVPPGVAELLHLPTRVLLGWVQAVAERSAAAPLGRLGPTALAVAAAGLAVAVVATRRGRPGLRRAGIAAAATVGMAAAAVAHAPPPLREALAPGVVRWHGGGTDVVALGGGGWRAAPTVPGVLAALREGGVGAVDVVVVVDAHVPGAVVAAVDDRHPVGVVLVPGGTPPGDRPVDAVVVPPRGTSLRVGDLQVLVVPGEDRLVVEALPRPG